jgi:AraC-like DNA-binding protein
LKDYANELEVLAEVGISAADIANPDLRIPHRILLKLLDISIQRSGDPSLGLHAGEFVEPGDFGPMQYAARNCRDYRTAVEINIRYIRLLDDTVNVSLTEEGEHAVFRISVGPTLAHPGVNDFVVAAALSISRQYLGMTEPPTEVRVQHAEATNVAEYERLFQSLYRLGADDNAIVSPREILDRPLVRANPELSHAFELEADRLLKDLPRSSGISRRVRELVLERLRRGDIGMGSIGKDLHMSVATLRRRLADEGTTHRDILDDVRRALALRHLEAGGLAVSEIAFLLGFSHVSSFSKAFRRWTGVAPLDYRARRK